MRARRSDRPHSLRQSLDSVRTILRERGICEWRIEADVLLRHVVELDRADFLSHVYAGEHRLTRSQSRLLSALTARRLAGEPLAYIVGRREFYGLELEVNENTLIPRQETELIVELALEYLESMVERQTTPTLIDVGTGSGAVTLAVATRSERVNLIGVDISRSALDVSMRNRDRLLLNRVDFVCGDLLTAFSGPVDIIVSNPPYIPSGALPLLAVEVRREPAVALDGGIDGLDHFRRLATQANDKLAQGGVMIVELMPEQMDVAMELARRTMTGVAEVYSERDLAGNRRALVAKTL